MRRKMLTKTVSLLQNSWSGWSKKKKLILAIPIILLIVLLCVLFFWDTEDKEPGINKKLENELDKQYEDKIKESDEKIKKLQEEQAKLEQSQKDLQTKREEHAKKLEKIVETIDSANTIDELRDIHKQLLSK